MNPDSKMRVSPALSAALVVPLTVLVTALALRLQPNEFGEVMDSFRQKPVLYALNALPVGLLLSAAAFAFGNVFTGAAFANAIVCALSVANRVKIEIRDEPVFPRDFALLREAGDALGSYHLRFPVGEIAFAAVVTLCLFGLGVMTTVGASRRAQERSQRILRGWRGRCLGVALCVAAFAVLTLTVYASNDLYNSLEASSPYRLSVVFNENGFLYNFCHQFTTYQVERPDGYDKSEAQSWDEAAPAESDAPKAVNVVLVMNEAFSDITDAPAFAFPPDNDPLARLHEIQADPHAVSLRLVVPGFAGGTANTEFDVFTGMQTNAIGAGTTSAMRTVNRNLDTLFRAFSDDGYRAVFYHPGDAWFYNRENVYRWFGASETLFVEEMENPEYKGRWVTDDYLAGLIEAAFDKSASDGVPLFHASTTIQNHMGYPYSKYGDGHEYAPVPLHTEVTPDVRESLEVYAEGVRDADRMLGRLRDFFATRPEPVLLIYYGDHLPYLGDGHLAYEELDMDAGKPDAERENPFSSYETPCVIWANDAAAEALDWSKIVKAAGIPDNGRISASFLGALILELTGRGNHNAWTAFLNDLRRQVPVVQNNLWMTPDGGVIDMRDAKDTVIYENVRKWRKWSYYKLQQKEWRG